MSKFIRVIKQSAREFSEDDMTTYAAAVSYQVFFSLFPFIIFLLALLGFLNLQSVFDSLLSEAEAVMPQDTFQTVEGIIGEIQDQASGGIMSFGVVVALWSSSSAVRMTMHAMNVAYGVEDRPVWKKLPLSILYAVLLAATIITSAVLVFMGPQLLESIFQVVGLGSVANLFLTLWAWLRIPVAVLLIMLTVALVYYLFPNYQQPFRVITPGAVIAVLVWVAASLAFSWYVSNFASYSATYGAVASVIVLLLYFFISAAILLFGAEINAETYREVAVEDDVAEDQETATKS